MRISTIALLLIASPSLVLAQGTGPTPKSEQATSKGVVREEKAIPTDETKAMADPGKADPRKAVGISPTVKAKRQAKKKAMAAGAARGRAEFQSALQQQQAMAAQNAALQQNQLLQQQMQQAQQMQKRRMIQQLTPQGQTVVKVNPDGTYETKTYYYYPNPILPP